MLLIAAAASWVLSCGPEPGTETRQSLGQVMWRSECQANVPSDAEFENTLRRDLTGYFEEKGIKSPTVRFVVLRRAATISGVAYPKFYVWADVGGDDGTRTSGALRLAAMGRTRFMVTIFVPAEEIRAQPKVLDSIFPAAVVPAIREQATVH